LFLPLKSRATLNDLENFVDVKIARLRFISSIETEQFRQAKYLNWCHVNKIPDPCGTEHDYERIVACFGEKLILDCHSWSATIAG
jgi:hypothetical protein